MWMMIKCDRTFGEGMLRLLYLMYTQKSCSYITELSFYKRQIFVANW
jgi:hypothetical protein